MKIVEIDSKEFDILSISEPNANIFQSSRWAEYMKGNGYEPLYVKSMNNIGNSEGVGMFLLKKESFFTTRYSAICPLGFLMNFYDEDKLIEFNDELLNFLKNYKVNKMTINPLILYHNNKGGNNEYISEWLKKLGYRYQHDEYIYEIETKDFNEPEFDKDIIFKVKNIEYGSEEYENILLDQENIRIYETLRPYSAIYINQFDSQRSIRNLETRIKDQEKFVQRHRDNRDYEQKINVRLDEIKALKKTIMQIEKLVDRLGENPILSIIGLAKYNGRYMINFIENKDENNFFNYEDYLISKIANEAKDHGCVAVDSLNEFVRGERKQLLGSFTISF